MLNISSELFLDTILLLLHDASSDTKDIVTQFLNVAEMEANQRSFSDIDLHRCFGSMARELLKLPDPVSKAEQAVVLLKFNTNPSLTKNPHILEALGHLFNSVGDMEESRIGYLRTKIRNSVIWYNCNKMARQIFGKLTNCTSMTDETQQELALNEVIQTAKRMSEIYSDNGLSNKKEALERIDLSDKESVRRGLQAFKDRAVRCIMRLGLQGLNRALGKTGGIQPGEFVVFAALPHQYKSGILMSVARDIVLYNAPSPELGPGVPTVLVISLENDANRNLMWWFRTAYETTFMKSSDGLSDDDVIDFIYEFYNRNGYRLIVERRFGRDFGFDEYANLIEGYEVMGHRIVASVVDYMNLMRREGASRDDLALRALYEAMHGYNGPKGIAVITAHALNRKASEVVSSGKTNIVKQFNGNMMADAMDIERTVDTLFFMHLETNQYGIRYLTLQLAKHRYVDDTPEKHKYCAYAFTPFGIPSDIEGPPGFTNDIYADKDPNSTDSTTCSAGTVGDIF